MKIALTMLVLAIAGPAAVNAKTYYIRADGGTADQCDGATDAAYVRGSKACAWAHPYWALNAQGKWKISGGDTLSLRGSFRIGAPPDAGSDLNTDWCVKVGYWECGLPPLPSGLSKDQPTRLVGAGWDTGCAAMPELWGSSRVKHVVNLSGTSHAVVSCLEITDHSSCLEITPDPSVRCERDKPPLGDWGSVGIYAARSSDVLLRNLNIHGLGSRGVLGGLLADWTLEDVRIVGNSLAGFDADLGGGQPTNNTGTITFRRVKVEWNGCGETWPGRQPDHCLGASKGGYGDGLVTGKSAGKWVIEDSSIRYNTSDGIDLLYLQPVDGQESSVEIRRTISAANAGNQIKVAGSAQIVNSVAVSNCGFFYQKRFAQDMGDLRSDDHCRARGGAIAIAMLPNARVSIINSTVASQGDTLVVTECRGNGLPPCNAASQLTIRNNLMVGYEDFIEHDISGFIWDPENFSRGRIDHNLIYRFKEGVCPPGGNLCVAPGIISDNIDSFDGHLRGSSPAIDAGLNVGESGGMIPSDDFSGGKRPTGRGVELGAYEYVSPSAGIAPVIETIRSAANAESDAVVPGSLVTLRGLRLAAEEKTAAEIPYPDQLANVDVRFGELAARILYVSASQVNVQVPELASGRRVEVTVRSGGAVSDPVPVEVVDVAPALFEVQGSQTRRGAVTSQDGVLIDTGNAAASGQVLTAYGTGLGAADEAAGGLRWSRVQPRVFVADIGAEVLFAGPNPAFPGLDQINFRMPRGLPSERELPLWIEQDGHKSQRVLVASAGF